MNLDKKLEEVKYNKDMGLKYSKDNSIFRVFSPPNENLKLRIYDNSYTIVGRDYYMEKDEYGVFEITLNQDLEGKFYTYITDGGLEVTDPYSFSSSVNSNRTAIIDLKKTDPQGFRSHIIPNTKVQEAIIYELHLKDFTFSKTSGVKYRGKFLGLAEENTSYNGISTGLDHLVELGVTHVHLLPIYDFLTVNEYEDYFKIPENYNWGYDPELYNVPEGSYSTIPTRPSNRIYELKQLIMALHEKGIKVIMDVVYNHLFRGVNSNFETLYPGYYLRYKQNGLPSDGAGVGTEMDSQSYMYRKFILDSIKFWMTEYKIDGFRFDLMGLIDIDTMEEVVKISKEINKDSIIYGEPWAGGITTLPCDKMTIKGSQCGKNFATFNDIFRDCIKGDNNGRIPGFAMGDFNKKICVENGIVGSIKFDSIHSSFTTEPTETINYVNSHDDLILADKIDLVLENSSKEDKEDVNKLALSILLLSFGIPFIHEGNEFLRSKRGIRNTYNAPITINQVDWSLKEKNFKVFEYIRDLIGIRKQIKSFSLYNQRQIIDNLVFLDFSTKPLIGYILKDCDEAYYLSIFNSGLREERIKKSEIISSFNKKFKKFIDDIQITRIFNKFGHEMENTFIYGDSFGVEKISTQVYKLEIRK